MSSETQERVSAAIKNFHAAQEELNRSLAESARLLLLEFAEENENIKGLTFESEYQYDDEGGYFLTDSVYVLSDTGLEEFDDEFSDAFSYEFGHEALAVLCGVSTDSYEGRITIKEARERSF